MSTYLRFIVSRMKERVSLRQGGLFTVVLLCGGSLWLLTCGCAGRRAARGWVLFLVSQAACVFPHTLIRRHGSDQYRPGRSRLCHGPVAPLTWTFFRFETHVISWVVIPSLPLCSPHLKYSKLLHFLIFFYVF